MTPIPWKPCACWSVTISTETAGQGPGPVERANRQEPEEQRVLRSPGAVADSKQEPGPGGRHGPEGHPTESGDNEAVMLYGADSGAARTDGECDRHLGTVVECASQRCRRDGNSRALEESRGDLGKAEAYYRKSLQIQPKQPVAANNLAYRMLENGENVDVALTLAQTARQAMPNSPSTRTRWRGPTTTREPTDLPAIYWRTRSRPIRTMPRCSITWAWCTANFRIRAARRFT
jgi:hypothetical protein